MDAQVTSPAEVPSGEPLSPKRLLTIKEAASETGLSPKALARRVERGTLRAVKDERGRRVVPRGELERAGLFDEGSPGGELVIWRDLYERERELAEQRQARAEDLERQLAAIAHAGPIRAIKLRRAARERLSQQQASL